MYIILVIQIRAEPVNRRLSFIRRKRMPMLMHKGRIVLLELPPDQIFYLMQEGLRGLIKDQILYIHMMPGGISNLER